MSEPDVITIVSEYLKQNGYDGLYLPSECACKCDDLAPCGEIQGGCTAGYLKPAENCNVHDWHIGGKNSDDTCGECDE